jgi:hypothetical protein
MSSPFDAVEEGEGEGEEEGAAWNVDARVFRPSDVSHDDDLNTAGSSQDGGSTGGPEFEVMGDMDSSEGVEETFPPASAAAPAAAAAAAATAATAAAAAATAAVTSSPAAYSFDVVVGLTGYTAATFDGDAQAAFVAVVANLGKIGADCIELTTVTDNTRTPLQKVEGLGHPAALPTRPRGTRGWSFVPNATINHAGMCLLQYILQILIVRC